LTIRKRDTSGSLGGRPAIKSSHEKVKVTRGPKPTGPGAATRAPRARTSARPGLPGARPGLPAARPALPGSSTRERPKGPRRPRLEPRAPGSPVRSKADAPPDASGAWSVASDSSRSTAAAIAAAAIEKKAVAVEILDVAGKVDYADFLVIMTGRSDRHAQALAQGIEEALRQQSRRPVAVEGLPNGTWVLMDFGDVVVHVFQEEARQLYDIEGLWLDARRLPVPAPDRP
jgi:ribosome-associated protein